MPISDKDQALLDEQLRVHLLDYDVPEVGVLLRMKSDLMRLHDWEVEDFEGMSFTDIEAEFLEVEPDFR